MRVRASNSFGWGPFSDEVVVRTDEVPAQIAPVSTIVQTSNIKIAWNKPSTDNGSQITQYKILIMKENAEFVESSLCNGSDPDIVQSETPHCIVPIALLRASPFLLSRQDMVVARVQARNI